MIRALNFQPNHHRVLANPAPYSSLIPAPAGIKVSEGAGGTFMSLEVMDNIATRYADQAKKLAQAKFANLPTLAAKVKAIRDFMYRNFQYKADESTQVIRSIAQSWAERVSGMDCKSYAVGTSSILQNLGIKHYFRKIKQVRTSNGQPQDFEQQYSHVYVVVPKDQRTGSLSSGYHVIDPVPDYQSEPHFLSKYDYPMMKHVSMAGVSCVVPGQYKDYQLKNITPGADGAVAVIEIFHKANPADTKSFTTPVNDCAKAVEALTGLGCDCSAVRLGRTAPASKKMWWVIGGTAAAIIAGAILISKSKGNG